MQTLSRPGFSTALQPLPDPAQGSVGGAPERAGRGLLAICANLYLIAFALAAGLSLLEQLVPAAPGLRRGTTAFGHALELASLGVWFAAFVTPQLSKRVLLPPAIFVVWCALGSAPLSFLVHAQPAREQLVLSLHLLVALASFLLVQRRTGHWLFPRLPAPRPLFRAGYTLGWGALALVLGPVLVLGYGVMFLADYALLSSDRFLSFSSEGVMLTERHYRRADDREIVLAGMAHVGRNDLYRNLFASFGTPSTVVLSEGVTDLKGKFHERLNYQPLADAIGLSSQPPVPEVLEQLDETGVDEQGEAPQWPQVWNADIDASEFSPLVLELLDRVARSSKGITEEEEAELGVYVQSLGRAGWTQIAHEIITRRDAHLVEKLDQALDDFEHVVVPWGVMHMPGIQRAVVQRGFAPVWEQRRLVMSYPELLRVAEQVLFPRRPAPAPSASAR